jgi:hypothetical protein
MMRKLFVLAIALLGAGSLTASATPIIGYVPQSAQIPIPSDLVEGGGPVTSGNYTWSSTNLYNGGGSVFGYTSGYGFGGNGSWDSAMGPIIALNDSYDDYGVTDTMTIAFTTPVYEVGDFFNYVPGGSTPTTIAVYDASMDLIESYNLDFLTSGGPDTGEWLGFLETTPISYFTMSDNYIAMATTPTPEPSTLTYFLLAAAVCGGAMFLAARKRSVIPPAV